MAKGRGPTKFKNSAAYADNGSSTGAKIETLADALAQDTTCGCGIECVCYGYLKLRNFDSTTGKYDHVVAYFVDGVIKYGTQAAAESEIQGYKDIAGGLVRA